MTPKQKRLHASLIKALHISKRYQGYYKENRDEYRELLQEHFKAESSKELSIDQLMVFVDYMNFKEVELPTYSHQICTKAQLATMRGLWNDFATIKTDEALLNFANRQTKKTYTKLHMVTLREAQKIIPVLETMKKNIIPIK